MQRSGTLIVLLFAALAAGCRSSETATRKTAFSPPGDLSVGKEFTFVVANESAGPVYYFPRFTLLRDGQSIGLLEAGCGCRCDDCSSCIESCTVALEPVVELPPGIEQRLGWSGRYFENTTGCGCPKAASCGRGCLAEKALASGSTIFEFEYSRHRPEDARTLARTEKAQQQFEHPLSSPMRLGIKAE